MHSGASIPRAAIASALAYVALTALFGRAVLAALSTTIASDPGDPVLNAAILQWNATHVPWTNGWFQFPIFYPTPHALVLSEHLLGVSLLAAPLYWLTHDALTAYNVTVLLSYPLCGMAMYALVWRLTRSSAPAFVSGLAYAFAPYRASQLPHIQVLTSFWAPLALLGLHEFLAAWRGGGNHQVARWLAFFAVCWMLQGASNGYFLIYFSVLIGLWILWFLVAQKRWRDAAIVIASMLAAALPLAPILYRYLTVQRELGLSRNLGEITAFGADIAAPLCAPATLTVWNRLRVACGLEGELFPGVALILACLIGWLLSDGMNGTAEAVPYVKARLLGHPLVRRARHLLLLVAAIFLLLALSVLVFGAWQLDAGVIRASASAPAKPLSIALALLLVAAVVSDWFSRVVQRGTPAAFYWSAAVICWIFSWGPFPRLFGTPVLYQAPFAWLLQLPGVGGLRVPARFWMMTVLCLCVLMGLVMARVLSRRGGRQAAVAVGILSAGLIADGLTTITAAHVNSAVPREAALSAKQVLVLPLGDLDRDVASVLDAVDGNWLAVNGFSGYEPVYYEALRTLSREHDAVLFEPFRARGELYVIVAESDGANRALIERQPGAALQFSRDGKRLYRLPQHDSQATLPPSGRRIPARAVSASCAAEGMAFTTDGDLSTEWVCGTQNVDHAITFDAGTVVSTGAIVDALGPHGAAFPRHLVIDMSMDGQTWETAWEGSVAAAVLRAAMDAPRETRVTIAFPARTGRYIRLRQTGRDERNYWSIAELEIWSSTE